MATLPLARRPAKGDRGTAVRVQTNFFPLAVKADVIVYQYDVAITPGEERRPRKLGMAILNLVKEKDLLPKECYPIFDGRKQLYTIKPIPEPMMKFKVSLPEDAKKGRDPKKPAKNRDFNVELKLTGSKSIAAVKAYLDGRSNEIPREVLQAIDIAVSFHLYHLSMMGRGFFNFEEPRNRSESMSGKQVVTGVFQAVRMVEKGLALTVDMAATVMITPGPVTTYLSSMLNQPNLQAYYSRNPAAAKKEFEKLIRDLKVEINYAPVKRRYRIRGITDQPVSRCMFELEGRQISVFQYFQKTYPALKLSDLPCALVGSQDKATKIPLEGLVLLAGQRPAGVLDAKFRSLMTTFTSQEPPARMATIQSLLPDRTVTHENYGLDLQNKGIVASGRMLPLPRIIYSDVKQNPSRGQWKMGKFLRPMSLGSVRVFNLEPRLRDNVASDAVNKFRSALAEKGLQGTWEDQIHHLDGNVDLETQIKKSGKPVTVVIVFTRGDNDSLYADLKRIFEVKFGGVVQCIDGLKVVDGRKTGSAYWENLTTKLNSKLGGINHGVETIFSGQPQHVAFWGADVHHPDPGAKSSPSIASVVSSTNRSASQWISLVREQEHRKEMIVDMEKFAEKHLMEYQRINKTLPTHVVMFRDGVGESMFKEVLCEEVTAIKLACNKNFKGYNPKITYIIVQKRNHVRFAPNNEGGRQVTDQKGNPLPGLVVDSDIVSSRDWEFYLVSHSALKGTSCVPRYTVLFDEGNYSNNQIQEMTLNLGHVYARCPRSVSIPAPCYYAHLVGYRARLYRPRDGDSIPLNDRSVSVHSAHHPHLYYM